MRQMVSGTGLSSKGVLLGCWSLEPGGLWCCAGLRAGVKPFGTLTVQTLLCETSWHSDCSALFCETVATFSYHLRPGMMMRIPVKGGWVMSEREEKEARETREEREERRARRATAFRYAH